MTLALAFQFSSTLLSLVAVGCAVFVAVRAGNWRKSEEWKELTTKIDAACKLAEAWHETPRAVRMGEAVEKLKGEVARHDVKFEMVASKADLAEFRGEMRGTLDGISRSVAQGEAGLSRIEGYMMENGK